MDELTHHAVVLEGAGKSGVAWAKKYIQETLELEIEANPDILFIEQERFSIADARVLKERASQSPFGSAQVFIIISERILREAQNALLKLLEEPAPNTHFIIIVPSMKGLLSTVQSRLTYGGRVLEDLQEHVFAKAFIEASIGERVRMLEPLIKKKERTRARNIVDALEIQLHENGVQKNQQALQEVVFVRNYLADTSSSLKMLLEHLALTI